MSTHTHAASTDSSEQPLQTPAKSNLLPKNCACGGSSGLSGGCKACGKNQLLGRDEPRDSSSIDRHVPPQMRGFKRSLAGHDFSQMKVHAPARTAESVQLRNSAKFRGAWSSVKMIGGLQEIAAENQETFIGGNGSDRDRDGPPSYAESNELLECIRIMGEENAEYCREAARDPANRAPHSARVATATNTAGPPAFSPCGQFLWNVGFLTSGRNGFLVQEIINTYNVQSCAGVAIPNPHPEPHYYEAWTVDAAGTVTPNVGATNDMWIRPARPNTRGSWGMVGNVHWAANLEPAAGFGVGNVGDAGPILMSTLTRPTNIAHPILTRRTGGTWDCCGGKNTHTPVG
jgi:hypothetical protein